MDPQTSDVALALENTGIYNGTNLYMFLIAKLKTLMSTENLLKPILIKKIKNITKWYHVENPSDKD